MVTDGPGTRLSRRLGTGDAVVIGLGSMIGAGVFAAIGPAAGAAGSGLLVGLGLAAIVAYCNATSSAQLAAIHPSSGGTYVYGRARLGSLWGYLAGWGFIVGKTASCAAMALTFGTYAAPSAARPLAVGAVLVLTTVDYFGVRKTAHLTRAIVAVVLISLAIVVAASLGGGSASPDNLGPVGDAGPLGVLRSAGLLFFAFAGYARIATLGEEVRDPARTIPRAIPLALGITLVVYAVVATAALLAAGPEVLAAADAPLEAAVRAGRLDGAVPVVRVGGSVAALGVLLSLILGVSRTTFAMAAEGDLPRWLEAVHPTHRVPHHAELAVGALVAALVVVVDLRGAIGFSSFAVLCYYAIANASAWTLGPDERKWPRWVATLGVGGCALLAVTLPGASVVAGVAVLAIGAVVHGISRRRAARGGEERSTLVQVSDPTDEVTVVEAIAVLRDAGFADDLSVAPGGAIRCGRCTNLHRAGDAVIGATLRVEGISDPDDEAVVFGLTCSHCGSRGVLVASYGPSASGDDIDVITALQDQRR
jgi:APA family basic amino acid/polyamine antiporter